MATYLGDKKIAFTLSREGGFSPLFLGCESQEEAMYLEGIMLDILDIKFKGDLI